MMWQRERMPSSRLFLYKRDAPVCVAYDVISDVIGCYGYDVNSAAAAAGRV